MTGCPSAVSTVALLELATLTGNAHLAEDLLQTVLTRVGSHWPKLAKNGHPEAYARKALVNQTISWRRRKRPR